MVSILLKHVRDIFCHVLLVGTWNNDDMIIVFLVFSFCDPRGQLPLLNQMRMGLRHRLAKMAETDPTSPTEFSQSMKPNMVPLFTVKCPELTTNPSSKGHASHLSLR